MLRLSSLITVLAGVALGQTPEAKVEGNTPPGSFWQRLHYTGLVDAFGGAHLESSQPTVDRVFDTNGRGVQLSYAKVGLWLDAAPIGFRVDVGLGQTIEVLSADTAVPVLRQFEQLYVSGTVPLHRGITVDFGRFLSPSGNESVDSRQSWLYSRAMLFGAAPFTHTGFRVTAPLTDAVTVLAGVVQGWDVIIDNNPGKTFFVSSVVTPTKSQSFALAVFGGPELRDEATWRFLIDGVWTAKLPRQFEISANVDAALEGPRAWYGASLSGHVTLERFDFAVRAEAFNDPQNVRLKLDQAPGAGAFAWEATVSARATLNQYLQARLEYRHDQLMGRASVPQDTLTFAVVAGI